MLTRLLNLFRGRRGRGVNGQDSADYAPTRRMPGPMLVAIAQALRPGGGGPTTVPLDIPQDENPREYWETRDRCSVLLDLLRRRPSSCAPALAACLRHEGFDEVAVRQAVGLLAPQHQLPRQLPRPNLNYRDRELDYAHTQGYEQSVALAGALAEFSIPEALKVAEGARQLNSNRSEALVILGALYQKAGQPASAAGLFEILVSQAAREEFRAPWARTLNQSGQSPQAIQVVNAAPSVSAELVLEKARALRLTGDPQAALGELRSMSAQETPDPNAYLVEQGACQYALQQYLQAVKTVAPAARSNHVPALRLSGLAHAGNQDWQQASEQLVRYVAQQADDAEAWRVLGEAYFGLGNYQEALRSAREAWQLDRNDRRAASLLAQSLIVTRQFDEAAEFARPFNPGILSPEYLAVLLLETHQLEQASQLLNRWVEQAPRNIQAWMSFGLLDEMMNDLDNAEQHYRQALSIKPDHLPAQEALRRVNYALNQ